MTVFGADADPANLSALADAGVTRAVLPLPVAPAPDLLRTLDRHASVLAAA